MKLTITKLTKKIMAVLTAVILAALAFLAVTAAFLGNCVRERLCKE